VPEAVRRLRVSRQDSKAGICFCNQKH